MIQTPNPEIIETSSVLGATIHRVRREQVFTILQDWFQTQTELFHILTADSLAVLRSSRNPDFAGLFQQANLIVPDGAGIMWAANFLGRPLVERIPGVSLVPELCKFAEKENWKVAFIGSESKVIDKAASIMKGKSPQLCVEFVHHGYFQPDSPTEESVLNSLANAGVSLIFVAMGVPRQEQFIEKLRKRGVKAVAIGVGGSFDVLTGRLPRAPQILQRFALEWLFRLCLEPKRVRRILQIPRFVFAVLQEKWKQ